MKVLVAVRHDDIGDNNYSVAFPILAARGIKGSFAVISDAIGTTFGGYNHMTAAQMREMKAAGHTFHNHTKSHQQNVLTTDTQANCYTEINTCRSALISNGLSDGISEDIFIPPYGEWGTNYDLAIQQANVKMTVGVIGSGGFVPQNTANAILTPQNQVAGHYIVRTDATSVVTNIIDRAIAKNVHGNGGYLILTYHHIVASPAAVAIERSTANYTTEMDYLKTKMDAGLVESVTLSELWERMRA